MPDKNHGSHSELGLECSTGDRTGRVMKLRFSHAKTTSRL